MCTAVGQDVYLSEQVNSWNAFHCNVDERKMRAMADAIVSTGLKKAGYEYINIDDCWQVMRSPNGSINSDPERFPGGMKALADYIHSKGLKFGVCAYCMSVLVHLFTARSLLE